MPKQDPKRVTTILLRDSVKEIGRQKAQQQNLSFSRYLEKLILEDDKK